MRIDHSLILAAGLGTRMGPIGQHLPKLMWPLFDRSLVSMQIEFASQLPIGQLFINAHHQAHELHAHLKRTGDLSKIHWLHETPSILDVGGAVHNLARHSSVAYRGTLLILNGDQFMIFNEALLSEALRLIEAGDDMVLFTTRVAADSGYSELHLDDRGYLRDIDRRRFCRAAPYATYTGSAIVRLDHLSPTTGASPFFDSVADYHRFRVRTLDTGSMEYWDFGTVDRYGQSLWELIRTPQSLFWNFLNEHQCVCTSELNRDECRYRSISPRTLNFSNHPVVNQSQGDVIVLASQGPITATRAGLYWNDQIHTM